jgi:hypothetical protein
VAERPIAIVSCVHGTWARGSRWPDFEAAVTDALRDCDGAVEFKYFEWSGRNSLRHRTRAAEALRQSLLQQVAEFPETPHILVAHSHGANVALHALDDGGTSVGTAEAVPYVTGVILLSPPILDCKLVHNASGAANRLFLGAVAALPLLTLTALSLPSAFGFSGTARVASTLIAAVLWLVLFIPARVRRRAEALARQLALPPIDFPGLVIQVPGDEATATLSSIAAFDRLARFVRSRILAARGFGRWAARGLRRARTPRDLTIALSSALALVPATGFWVWLLYRAAEQGQWPIFSAVLPLAIVIVTGALATVGGSVLLLLLLPTCSFLLWPFGIFPTAAATLLTASIEPSPAATWRVVRLPRLSAAAFPGWRHSTYRNRAALDAACVYLRSVLRVRTPSRRGLAAL